VTRSVPAYALVAGVPARQISVRDGHGMGSTDIRGGCETGGEDGGGPAAARSQVTISIGGACEE
jgi:hypothetical protein